MQWLKGIGYVKYLNFHNFFVYTYFHDVLLRWLPAIFLNIENLPYLRQYVNDYKEFIIHLSKQSGSANVPYTPILFP